MWKTKTTTKTTIKTKGKKRKHRVLDFIGKCGVKKKRSPGWCKKKEWISMTWEQTSVPLEEEKRALAADLEEDKITHEYCEV